MVSVLGNWLKRVFVLLILMLLLVLLVNFLTGNPQMIQLQLAGAQLPALRVSSTLVFAFICGGVVGLLVSMFAIGRLRLSNASYQRKLARRDAELHKLRAEALKGLR